MADDLLLFLNAFALIFLPLTLQFLMVRAQGTLAKLLVEPYQ